MSIVNGGLIAYNLENLPEIVESEQSNGSVTRNVKGWYSYGLVKLYNELFTAIP